ncbi:ATP-binding protein [Marinibaculum pumilum]|uniref:histidine kinase n=1 Tax=Marinibaculum pumilum TaxID=1766165 RepID=A0ABV7L3G0_9PROT
MAVGAAILALFVYSQWQSYDRAIARAERDTRNAAFLLAEHAARTFDGIEVTLQAVGRLRQDVARGIYRSQASIYIHLKTLQSGAPILREIGWFDLHGERVASSADIDPQHDSIAREDLFQVPRSTSPEALYISAPQRVPAAGAGPDAWQIGVSWRLEDLDGSFAGVAVGMLDPEAFARVYRALDLGPGVTATLLSGDGVVLAHAPDAADRLGRSTAGAEPFVSRLSQSPAGTFHAPDPFDGSARIAGYATVDGFGDGLLVSVGMPRAQALAGFRRGFALQAVVTGGILAALAVAAALLAGGLRRREKLQSQLRAANAEAQAARLEAERASEAKSAFLANVSHELRTPLTLILAPLEQLLGQDRPPADWRPQMERMKRNAALLLNRVNDTLDFSKAEAGKTEIRWEEVDLTALVPALCDDAAAVARGKDIDLSCRIDPALHSLSLDRRHLEKILLNLISNALKFTPSGGTVRVEASPLGEESFEIAVSDTGPGIPPDKVQLLFQRFQQLDPSPTRQYGGTGIGLALVKQFAELMGGSVGVESIAGSGARFSVHLPRRNPAGGERPAGQTGAPATGGEALQQRESLIAGLAADIRSGPMPVHEPPQAEPQHPAGGTMGQAIPGRPRVLVAEDNADLRAYVADLLRDSCTVLTAVDGLAAWELLQRQPVDVVLSDIMMPRLDGLALAGRIRAAPNLAHIPVILLTARGGSEASASGLEQGADDYIAKPFVPAELRARVRAALRMAQAQAELRQRSRQAGMSAVAIGILHNLGNLLNGVTIAASLIEETLRSSALPKLGRVADLLKGNAADLQSFLTEDERGRVLPAYLAALHAELRREHGTLTAEFAVLNERIVHAVGILTTQQALTKRVMTQEVVPADELMDTALRLSQRMIDEHGVSVERDYVASPAIFSDVHKILQILLNLMQNACHAMHDLPEEERVMRVRCWAADEKVWLEVRDNGVGIEPDRLPQIFNQGFTTKSSGHGLGLHSSANFARELGGRLTCRSAGAGMGASFTLELPDATSVADLGDDGSSGPSAPPPPLAGAAGC